MFSASLHEEELIYNENATAAQYATLFYQSDVNRFGAAIVIRDKEKKAIVNIFFIGAKPECNTYIDRIIEPSQPRVKDLDTFLEDYSDEKGETAVLWNKVKICASCSKPNAFTLAHCNACAHSLVDLPVVRSVNVFVCFIMGIGFGKFPLGISIRYQDPNVLIFDDLLQVTHCHLNAIPTSSYISDWRYLLNKPKEALELLDDLYNKALDTVFDQFWSNKEWRKAHFRDSEFMNKAELANALVIGFNYPPSQYQLHMQVMLPPFLPFQYSLYLQGIHMTKQRFFPLPYIRAVLNACLMTGPMQIKEDTIILDIINHFDGMGIAYDDMHMACFIKAGSIHRRLAHYQSNRFKGIAVQMNNETVIYESTQDGKIIESEQEEIASWKVKDKDNLQNYGRPYNVETNKPTTSYYAHTKSKLSDLPNW